MKKLEIPQLRLDPASLRSGIRILFLVLFLVCGVFQVLNQTEKKIEKHLKRRLMKLKFFAQE